MSKNGTLARPRWQNAGVDVLLRASMLANERAEGDWLFIIDATLCGQAGKKTENTHSTGNRKRRPTCSASCRCRKAST